MIGNYLWCNLPVWCSCRACINYSVRQGCATCGPRAKCNTTKRIFMPATSTRQPVWNEGAARCLFCLIAFGPSVIKVAHPWYTTICETSSLINACDLHPGHHRAPGGRCTVYSLIIFTASLNVINLVLSPKADMWKQCVEITDSQHSPCLHCPQQSGNFSHASNKNELIGIWHHPSSLWHTASEIKSEEAF